MTPDTQKKYNKVLKLVKAGQSVKNACTAVNIHKNYFYSLRRDVKKPPITPRSKRMKRVMAIDLPAPLSSMSTPLFLVVGNKNDLIAFAKGFN